MDTRSYNVKVRGMLEQAEGNTELQAFNSNWLAAIRGKHCPQSYKSL